MGTHNNGAQDVRRLTKYVYAFEYGRFDESGLTTRICQGAPQRIYVFDEERHEEGTELHGRYLTVCLNFIMRVLSSKPMIAPSTASTTVVIQRPVLDGFSSLGGPGIV